MTDTFHFCDSARTVTMSNRVGRSVVIPYAKASIYVEDQSWTKYAKGLVYLDYGVVCETCSDKAQDAAVPAVDCNCGAHRPAGEISWRVSH